MVFKSVNDLLERTYCIIERIHFAGPSAARTGYTVAASLEKTRTYLVLLTCLRFWKGDFPFMRWLFSFWERAPVEGENESALMGEWHGVARRARGLHARDEAVSACLHAATTVSPRCVRLYVRCGRLAVEMLLQMQLPGLRSRNSMGLGAGFSTLRGCAAFHASLTCWSAYLGRTPNLSTTQRARYEWKHPIPVLLHAEAAWSCTGFSRMKPFKLVYRSMHTSMSGSVLPRWLLTSLRTEAAAFTAG